MELGEPDASGRRRPVEIPGSEFVFPCEMVVVAIGTKSNPLLTSTSPDLRINKWGYIEIDDNLQTSMDGVFAGGDIVRGAATVILAMGDGKKAAREHRRLPARRACGAGPRAAEPRSPPALTRGPAGDPR